MSAIVTTSTNERLRRAESSFTSWELDHLRCEARAHRTTISKYIRAALLHIWGEGPALHPLLALNPPPDATPSRRDKLVRGPLVTLIPAERTRLAEEAKACGMTQAKYMRQAVTSMWHHAPKPKRQSGRDIRDLTHALALMSFQVKKLGTNVNQLAHQANAGMVPITDAELRYVLNQHQLLMSAITAAVERVTA